MAKTTNKLTEEPACTVVGMQIGAATLKNQCGESSRLKINGLYDQALWYMPKGLSRPVQQMLAQPCLLVPYSQRLGNVNSLNVRPQRAG